MNLPKPPAQTSKAPIRVLFMISSMRGGGSEQQTLLLLRHLDRQRFTPHLYLTDRSGPLLDLVPSDVTVHHYEAKPTKFKLPGSILRRQIKQLRSLLIDQGIEVIYDRTFHMSLLAGPAARACRIPRVSTMVSPPDSALPLLERRYRWLKKRRLSRAYRHAHSLVAVSRQVAESAENFYRLKGKQVLTIPNPVDREKILQAATQCQVSRDNRWTFACIARMTKEKGHIDLIRAILMLEDDWPEDTLPIHLWLIGDGPLRNELEKEAEKLKTHQVSFLGVQQNPWQFIQAADAVVLPSHFEGMPNVVLEAMCLRTPVIATRIGGTSELEKEKPTICWINPHSPDSIANALVELATRPTKLDLRVEAAEELIKKNHDLPCQVNEIEKLLSAAVQQRPA